MPVNRYKILSKKYINKEVNTRVLQETTIILHLYYDFLFEEVKKYIETIPLEIDVYIVTANAKLEILANRYALKKDNIKVLRKINRGRDFATLLIACKRIIPKYKYICFIHDKNTRSDSNETYTSNWRKLFYESTICSKAYILNVLNEFETNKKIGLLSVPIPSEQLALEFRGITWFGNIDLTKEWLKKLKVKYEFNLNQDSISIGSVFWFRKEALEQLFNYNFKYSDFALEPMPHDFTLAHCFERIVGLLSEKNGYKNYYVMNDEYAELYFAANDSFLTKAMKVLRASNIAEYDDKNGLNLDKSYKKASRNNTFIKYCRQFKSIIIISDNNQWYDDNLITLKRNNVLANRIIKPNEFKPEDFGDDDGIIVCTTNRTLLKKLKNKNYFLFNNHE